MEWVVLLFVAIPLGALAMRLYERAAIGPRLTAEAVGTAAALIIPITVVFVALAIALHNPDDVENALGGLI